MFTDDFTSNAAGWSTGKGSDSESYLDGGALHVLVYQTSWTAFSVNQGIVFQDFILTVDATPIQVPDGSGYGVDFRTSKVGSGYNYYSLEILASGSYLFQKCVDGRCTTILGPTASPTIRTGKQANKILIQARGNTFSFYANGTLLATTTDDTLVSGGIAFPVFSAGQPGTHVAFDNVKVWQVRPAGAEEALFDLGNSQPVQNGPANPTLFALDRPRTITLIQNYHLNDGRGAVPGQIMLRAQDGTQYGPWQASGAPSQSGVANAYWVVHPEVVLPADTYVILDSDTSTWSQNSQTDRRGMTLVKGY